MTEPAPVPRVLFVDDDPTTQASARAALADAGVDVVEATTVDDARAVIAREPFAAAIVDVRLGADDGLVLVRELRAAYPRLPVVVLSRITEFTVKIEAMRAGADAYFEKPVDWLAFSRSVRSLVSDVARPARLLVVDDDPVSAQVLRHTLENAGYEVRLCSQPERFEDELRALHPDLILMDIDLPGISGFELARYIRQNERFETVPLIYVTGTAHDERTLAVAAAGGEQILRKPVPADVLLAAVAGRLGHFLRLRRLIDRDPLSGVLMRRSFLERIGEAVATFRRTPGRRFTLAFLDLDHFKNVNDRHGHAAGDRVLVSLGETMRRGTRASDALGRYGGEEFGILLGDTGADGASQLIERLLHEFGEIRHGAPDDAFAVTFSAGLAELTEGESAQAWQARADRALYEAKAAGRNCVRVAPAPAPVPFPEPLDPEKIASLRELGELSGEDIIHELAELFFEIAPERIARMRKAIDERDGASLQHAAHTLRGASGNLGARAMHVCCAELEAAGAASSWDDAIPAWERLSAAYVLTSEALRHLSRR